MTELSLRIVSAAVLAPLALGAIWWGGAAAIGLFVLIAFLMTLEWRWITAPDTGAGAGQGPSQAMTVAAALAVGAAVFGASVFGLAAGVVAVAGVAVILAAEGGRRAPNGALLAVVGAFYCGLPALAAIGLRRGDSGLDAMAIVLLLVWATDTAAFFAGRAIGGPKLWPRVSPKKTWSGAIGGLIGGVAVAGVYAAVRQTDWVAVMLVAIPLSMASQAGDLFESALKRRFGVKDSSRLIPGHGGILDRVDGLVFALMAAYIFGYMRNAPDVAAGLVGR